MAAPDRVYRLFTNLLSKEYSLTEQNPLVIRGAKPLRAYITPNISDYSLQLDELKQKFKIDGILWLKNPNTPSVPHSDQTDEDDPDTVSITDPSDPTHTRTIADPDMNDPDRNAFIAYVWAPAGEGGTDISSNYKFHDIRGWDGEGIQGNSNATDYSTRSWSRASKLRYKEYNVDGTAIILNDAGLNRRGDCSFPQSGAVTPYIDQSVIGAKPRFNDIKVVGNFFSTQYNKLNSTILEMSQQSGQSYLGFQQVSNAGIIPKLGISGDPRVAIPVKFIGRKNPNSTETGYVGKISYPSGMISVTINAQSLSSEVNVTIPSYAFRLRTVNEEGETVSEILPDNDIGLYIWNKDDSIDYGEAANNSETDRVSLSHRTSAIALQRYNDCMGATENQENGYVSQDPNHDPDPNENQEVLLLYSKSNIFEYSGDPEGGRTPITANNMEFFWNERAGAVGQTPFVYDPFLTGEYLAGNTNLKSHTYMVMRCTINDTTAGAPTPEETVHCLEYTYYGNSANKWLAISRYWKLEYDQTLMEWYWPKSRYNKNVRGALVYSPEQHSGQAVPIGVTSLSPAITYYINALINNVTAGETYKISITNQTPTVAQIGYYEGSNWNAITQTSTEIHQSSGDINWLYDILRIKRLEVASTAQTFTEVSTVTINVTYQSYTLMESEFTEVTDSFDINTIGVDPNNIITGVIMFNGYSEFGAPDYLAGPSASPANILSDAKYLPGHVRVEDTPFYLGNDGKLYKDGSGTLASQGYYLIGWNGVVSGSADGFRYVDALGNISTLHA